MAIAQYLRAIVVVVVVLVVTVTAAEKFYCLAGW